MVAADPHLWSLTLFHANLTKDSSSKKSYHGFIIDNSLLKKVSDENRKFKNDWTEKYEIFKFSTDASQKWKSEVPVQNKF